MTSTAPDRVPQEIWKIDYNELTLQQSIGSGGYGEVFRGMWGGTEVAIKQVWISPRESKDIIESFRQEVAVLTALRHPNIVLFLGACPDPPNLSMVMEFIKAGNLRKLLNRESIDLPWSLRVRMAADAARALLYLHKKNIIHRDLKSANLLVDDNIRIKVCDFGLARVKSAQTMSVKGTSQWMAPEVAHGDSYDEKADCFSFGVILAELITREDPDEMPRRGFMRLEFDVAKLREMFSPECPKEFADLCCQCVQKDPAARPPMAEIVDRLASLEKSLPPVDESTVLHIQAVTAGKTPTTPLPAATAAADSELGEASALVGDQESDQFWAENFGESFDAKWEDFVKAASRAGLPEAHIEKIVSILSADNGVTITKRRVAAFLKYFRSFRTGLQGAVDLCGRSWFHGYQSDSAVAELLRERPTGTFFVRLSEDEPGAFMVSFVKEGATVGHAKITEDVRQGFSTDGKKFYRTLDDLIFAHSTKSLRTPLPAIRRQYDSL